MKSIEPSKPRFNLWGLLLFLSLPALLCRDGAPILYNLYRIATGGEAYYLVQAMPAALLNMAIDLAFFVVFAILAIWILSRFIFRSKSEIKSFWYLHWNFLGLGGPFDLVRDGELLNQIEAGFPYFGNGALFVDQNSAGIIGQKELPNLLAFLFPKQVKPKPISLRVVGPGLWFLRWSEKVNGAVDQRKQSRVRPNILANTLDGIQVKTTIWTIFSISMEPDTVFVTQVGPDEQSIQVVHLVEKKDAGPSGKVIAGFVNAFGPEDQQELQGFLKSYAQGAAPEAPPFDALWSERILAAHTSRSKVPTHSERIGFQTRQAPTLLHHLHGRSGCFIPRVLFEQPRKVPQGQP